MRSVFLSTTAARMRALAVLGVSIFLFPGAITSFSQTPMPSMGQAATPGADSQNKQLQDQIVELRAEIAKLQAAVDQSGSGNGSKAMSGKPMPAGKGMGKRMMGDKGKMGGMGGGMAPGADKPMAAPGKEMGMSAMGMPPAGSAGMAAPAPPGMAGMSARMSAMRGQSGGSLLHVGSTGFFLDHSQHITLTADQTAKLNHMKEKAMLDQASEQRRIDQQEQELYTLTGADQPDNAQIQPKLREIEKLRGEQRMNFIRAVGEASNVLTPEQHQALMGTMTAGKP